MRRRAWVLGLVFTLIASGAANADVQERMLLESLSPGSKLRVAVPPRWIEGELMQVDRSTGGLVLTQWRGTTGTRDIPLDQITAVEYRRGTRRLRGTLIGAGIGLLGGGALGALEAAASSTHDGFDFAPAALAILGLIGGCTYGALIGSPDWEPVNFGDVNGEAAAQAP